MYRKKVKRMPKGYDKNYTPKILDQEWRKILLDYHFFCAKRFFKGREVLIEMIRSLPTKQEQSRAYAALDNMNHARSLLDDHYHGLISDKEFSHWGHLWYSGDGKIHDRRENV